MVLRDYLHHQLALRTLIHETMLSQTAFNFSCALHRLGYCFSGLRLLPLFGLLVFLAYNSCVGSASSYCFVRVLCRIGGAVLFRS